MKKASQILDLPVMGIKEGVQKGIAKDFIVGTQSKAVEYLLVQAGRRYNPLLLSMADVASVGKNFVMVKSIETLQSIFDKKEYMDLAAEGFYMLDAQVLSDDGDLKGIVQDFDVDTETGKVEKIYLENGSAYSGEQLVTLSGDFVFVSETGDAGADTDAAPVSTADDESKAFLVGRILNEELTSADGTFTIAAGTVLTSELVETAERHDMIPLLVLNAE